MFEQIPKDKRIFIIEGIAGSGKTTFKDALRDWFKDGNIYEFGEEELLLGWKHIHVPHMSALRVKFFNTFLSYIEKKLLEEKDSIFIFERFHLSMKILEWEFENNFNEKYQEIVERIRALPVFILIVKLDPSEIKSRMWHRDRNKQWDIFVEEKLKLRGFGDLEELSIDQQKQFFERAEEQDIPFAAFKS